jgi:hypothetical protein
MYHNNIVYSIIDSNNIDNITNLQNLRGSLFLWVLNPDNMLLNKLPKDAQIYCNTVYISKQKEEINSVITSEYDSYFENIRFKALNRLLFLNYRIITFTPADKYNNILCNEMIDYDIVLNQNGSFAVKNSFRVKKFFWDFEDYIVHQKNLPQGRNIFSKHNFFEDMLNLNQNYNLKISEN